jgi:hypothetical protein
MGHLAGTIDGSGGLLATDDLKSTQVLVPLFAQRVSARCHKRTAIEFEQEDVRSTRSVYCTTPSYLSQISNTRHLQGGIRRNSYGM